MGVPELSQQVFLREASWQERQTRDCLDQKAQCAQGLGKSHSTSPENVSWEANGGGWLLILNKRMLQVLGGSWPGLDKGLEKGQHWQNG